ncbi:hypothetical protein BDW59DRAFT_154288 [Aspergillus cavernicola]|uniref:Uncharacterized protein n=1 Tax=Aspergillus cavernicola TaxID=176166 RepID=A0ABR4HGF7_9EURO
MRQRSAEEELEDLGCKLQGGIVHDYGAVVLLWDARWFLWMRKGSPGVGWLGSIGFLVLDCAYTGTIWF